MSKRHQVSELAKREEKLAFRLLLPTFLVLFLVAFYPLVQVFYTSFTNKTFASSAETKYIGFENYRQLLSMTIKEMPPIIDEVTGKPIIDPETNKIQYKKPIDVLPRTEKHRYKEVKQFNFAGKHYILGATDPDFINSIRNTLIFTIVSVFLETVLGVIIALVVNSNFKGRGIMRAVMLVPWAVITVVSSRIWEWMLAPNRTGFFNTLFDKLGWGNGDISFLSQGNLALPSIIAVDVWKTAPFIALLALAGLQTISEDIYEAADIDGASKPYQLFSITLPLLKPTLAVALIFRTLDALRVFDVFQVMLSNRKYSMATYNYFQLIGNRNMGLASAIGVILFILIFIFAISYIKALGVDAD